MLHIEQKDYNPDTPSFGVRAVEPDFYAAEQRLLLYSGKGTYRRSWGQPKLNSEIFVQTDTFVAVFVSYWHQYGGGSFYRYYATSSDGVWQQRSWAQLADDVRQIVLDAYKRLPDWAKLPGKLRSERAAPEIVTKRAYKFVAVYDNRYYSIYKSAKEGQPAQEYVLGQRMQQKARSGHGGGFYSYQNKDMMLHFFRRGELLRRDWLEDGMTIALLEVEISGTILYYPIGDEEDVFKQSSTYLRPIREVQRFIYRARAIAQ